MQCPSSAELNALPSAAACIHRLCEINVVEQVINVGNTTIVQDAWTRDQPLTVHGWIYDLADGLLNDLHVTLSSRADVDALQRT